MHIHGGGPVICREELDIYSAECKPEEDLYLEDLRNFEGHSLATRMSWQFVDECRGDIQLFEQKYAKALRKAPSTERSGPYDSQDPRHGSPGDKGRLHKSDQSETNGVML